MVNLKMDKLYTLVIALGGVIGVVLNLWLATQYSYLGAAWAWFFTELAIVVVMWFFLYRKNIQVIQPQYFTYKFISTSVQPMYKAIAKKLGK